MPFDTLSKLTNMTPTPSQYSDSQDNTLLSQQLTSLIQGQGAPAQQNQPGQIQQGSDTNSLLFGSAPSQQPTTPQGGYTDLVNKLDAVNNQAGQSAQQILQGNYSDALKNVNSPENQALTQHALGLATMGIAAPAGASAAGKLGSVGLNPATATAARGLTAAQLANEAAAATPAVTQYSRPILETLSEELKGVQANPNVPAATKGLQAQRLRSILGRAKSQGIDTSGLPQSE